MSLRRYLLTTALAVALGTGGSSAAAAAGFAQSAPPASRTGVLADGATYVIDVPARWNGTLLLYSHGLVPPGSPNPAVDGPDPLTDQALLQRGYALAGTSYASTGFAVEDALRDQLTLLAVVGHEIGTPRVTIGWGSSLGGLVTAAMLERRPHAFDGGLSLCGPLAGSVGLWDSLLDPLFALRTLLASDPAIDLVNVRNPQATLAALQEAVAVALATPEGRARIALAAAVGDVPGWAGAGNPQPDPADVDARLAAQVENLATVAMLGVALRADVEQRAGGNPSTNAGVDYAALLQRSNAKDEVVALYERAGVDLDADLGRLASAPRIQADEKARRYLTRFATLDGELRDPMVTLHTEGDPIAVVENEQAYRATVHGAGENDRLRRLFTARAGHCTFTPAEVVTALDMLLERVERGRWEKSSPAALNEHAAGLGEGLNVHVEDDGTLVPTPPAFGTFRPGPFLRPFDRS